MVRHDFQEIDDIMALGELFAAWKQWFDEVMPDAAPMSFATKTVTEADEFSVVCSPARWYLSAHQRGKVRMSVATNGC